MDLSLAPTTTTSSDQEQDRDHQELTSSNIGGASTSSGTTTTTNTNFPMMMIPPTTTEKEHMFDKVVTPSDVGKLNRLVIPKQHAERYFPLDSTNNQNGTLLNFQDRNGKMWRFRYSYWNSSQSYVMTKGWSRFVKEKKLDAGDIVSFQRGIGDETERSKLYIDWRHRPDMSLVHQQQHYHQFGNNNNNNNNFGFNFNRFQPLPMIPRSLSNYHHHQQRHHQQELVGYGYGYGGRCYYTGSPLDQRNIVGSEPLVIESVPVVPGRSLTTPAMFPPSPPLLPPPHLPPSGKRLRLFGVNMECGGNQEESWMMPRGEMGASSSSTSNLQLNLSTNDHDDDDEDGDGDEDDQFAKKGKSSIHFF